MADFVCNSFKQELLQEGHNFTNAADAFYWALFTNAWTGNNASTTDYTVTNETSGTNYVAGGTTVANVTPTIDTNTAIVDFSTDPTWSSASFTARFTLLYNSSSVSTTDAVANWDFGSDQTASGGDFILQLPTPAAATAILRLA